MIFLSNLRQNFVSGFRGTTLCRVTRSEPPATPGARARQNPLAHPGDQAVAVDVMPRYVAECKPSDPAAEGGFVMASGIDHSARRWTARIGMFLAVAGL